MSRHLSHIACLMLSAGRGGLEQSMADYCLALHGAGHEVTAICHPRWPGRADLDTGGVRIAECRSLGEWDPFAAARIRRLVRRSRADLVLTIGRRATGLTRKALGPAPAIPVVAQTPNYKLGATIGLDLVIATTKGLARALREAGQPSERITVIPNLVRVPEGIAVRAPRQGGHPVIGALGRFVPKKGFVPLIDALALLDRQGVDFTCRLAGDGPDRPLIRARIAQHGLGDRVELPGWIDDTASFFAGLDVFCVPSLHEPFGIVVIEGFAHALATVVTDAEGPAEIVTPGKDALVVRRGEPEALAEALRRLIGDPELRSRLAGEALAKARSTYDLAVVAGRISTVLSEVVERFRRETTAA